MKPVTRKRPQLGFKCFDEDWEQHTLKEIVKKQIKGKAQLNNLGEGNIDYLDASRLNGGIPFFTNGTKNVEKDDILILWDGSKAGTVYTGFSGALGSTLKAYKTTSNSTFVYQFLKRQQELIYKNYRTPNIPHVQKDFLNVFKISTPNFAEQQKIGTFFKQLDELITLRQHQLDQLKALKKGYLQKMFPRNGVKVPELRFKGFADDWEQRKVSSISKKTYGGGTPKTSIKEFWNGVIPWIQSSDLESHKLFNVSPKKYITNESIRKSATKLVPANSIAIVTRVGVGKLALMTFEYTTSQDFLSLSDLQVDPYFGIYSLYAMLQKESNDLQGTSIKGITKLDLLDKELMIPKKNNEQEKIGIFFRQLEKFITLNQHKLDKLKELKKAYLQKMFC